MAILYGTLPNGSLVPVEADDQGRLVAELAPTNTPTGAFRNVLINGSLAINQRGEDVASVAVGAYGQDRWKRTAGGMTQVVEEGTFVPGVIYTLSGTGVTTQQLTSPASGHWTIPDVPVTARNIQLEQGPVQSPFELRPPGIELSLCERYFFVGGTPDAYPNRDPSRVGLIPRIEQDCTAGNEYRCDFFFRVSMRDTPVITLNAAAASCSGAFNCSQGVVILVNPGKWQWKKTAISTGHGGTDMPFTADAEL